MVIPWDNENNVTCSWYDEVAYSARFIDGKFVYWCEYHDGLQENGWLPLVELAQECIDE